MNDRERAREYLCYLYVLQPGNHAYELDSFIKASEDVISMVALLNLLEEVREDERKKLQS